MSKKSSLSASSSLLSTKNKNIFGYINLGYTCFMNSLLQGWSSSKLLIEWLTSICKSLLHLQRIQNLIYTYSRDFNNYNDQTYQLNTIIYLAESLGDIKYLEIRTDHIPTKIYKAIMNISPLTLQFYLDILRSFILILTPFNPSIIAIDNREDNGFYKRFLKYQDPELINSSNDAFLVLNPREIYKLLSFIEIYPNHIEYSIEKQFEIIDSIVSTEHEYGSSISDTWDSIIFKFKNNKQVKDTLYDFGQHDPHELHSKWMEFFKECNSIIETVKQSTLINCTPVFINYRVIIIANENLEELELKSNIINFENILEVQDSLFQICGLKTIDYEACNRLNPLEYITNSILSCRKCKTQLFTKTSYSDSFILPVPSKSCSVTDCISYNFSNEEVDQVACIHCASNLIEDDVLSKKKKKSEHEIQDRLIQSNLDAIRNKWTDSFIRSALLQNKLFNYSRDLVTKSYKCSFNKCSAIIYNPKCLILQLNRSGSYGEKYDTFVRYPLSLKIPYSDPKIVLESNTSNKKSKDIYKYSQDLPLELNFKSFRLTFSLLMSSGLGVPSSSMIQSYNLNCIIEHIGGTGISGHYVSFKRWKNSWCRISDSKVSSLSESEVLSRQAYLLFY